MCASAESLPAPPSLVVVGDPQLHSIYGGRLRQASPEAGILAKVAQRNPETNLLAEHVLLELIDRATDLPGGSATDPVILLGDGTNVACTGEFERLNTRLQQVRGKNRVVLWAPGNHDFYMMGTTNDWIPTHASLNPDALQTMSESPLPVDASFWLAPTKLSGKQSWNFFCDDGKGSVPINKGQWIARYLASLGSEMKLESSVRGGGSYAFHGKAQDGPLALGGYEVRGRWYPPVPGQKLGAATNLVFQSYLVQAFDVGATHRLILIDTTQCGHAPLISKRNAGVRACVSPEQIEDIRILSDTQRRLVFGGHFPLKDLQLSMRRDLLNVFNAGHRRWTYLSAHTHRSHSVTSHIDGKALGPSDLDFRFDVNFGSTTDWPMEAHRVMLDDSAVGVSIRDTGFQLQPYAQYVPRVYRGPEVCRHVAALDALLALRSSTPSVQWRTPEVSAKCEEDLRSAQDDLRRKMKILDQSMTDPVFRERAMMVARSASAELERRNDAASFLQLIP